MIYLAAIVTVLSRCLSRDTSSSVLILISNQKLTLNY